LIDRIDHSNILAISCQSPDEYTGIKLMEGLVLKEFKFVCQFPVSMALTASR
jgi:hypothetical protein